MTETVAHAANITARNVTVFIVDDDADLRRALAALVGSVGFPAECFSSAQDFLERHDPEKAGCLLLDVRMPGMSGLELQQVLNAGSRRRPIIFLSAHGEIPLATRAIRSGAVDFFQKPFSPQTLLERVREAVNLDLADRQRHASSEEVERRVSRLTARECEVMHMLAHGRSTKQIAQQLAISPKTVDNHRAKVLEKMCVDNPTQLAHLVADIDPAPTPALQLSTV